MQSYSKKESAHVSKRVSPVKAFALAAAILSFSAAEPAMAQPATSPSTQNSRAECRVEEIAGGKAPKIVHLNSKDQSLVTYYTLGSSAKQGDPKPSIRCSGPARITIEIYPLINKKKQREGDPMPLSFSIDGKVLTKEGAIKASGLNVVEYPLPAEIGVAHPLKIEFTIEKGDHELLLLHPAGFLRIAKVEEVKQAPLPQTQPIITKPEPKPVENKGPVLDFQGKRLGFAAGKSKGDINELDGYVALKRLGSRLSLIAGTHLSSYGLSSAYPEGTAGFRSGSFNLGAGLSLSAGGHTVAALPFAGVRLVKPSFGELKVSGEQGAEFGGVVWYEYRDRFGLIASGSNNPANPISLSAFAAVPYGWVKGYYPRLGLDARWIHVFRDNRVEGDTIVIPLHGNDFLARVMADVPLVKIPRIPLVPSLIAGVEFSRSGYNGTFVGGAITLKAFRMLLGSGAAVTVDKSDHRLMLFLNIRK